MKQFIVLFLAFCDLVYISSAYHGECRWVGKQFNYNTVSWIESITDTSEQKCAEKCRSDVNCQLWSVDDFYGCSLYGIGWEKTLADVIAAIEVSTIKGSVIGLADCKKPSTTTTTSTTTPSTTTSAAATTTTTKSAPNACFSSGFMIPGNNLGGSSGLVQKASAEECQKYCQQHPDCLAFQYNKKNANCRRKTVTIGEKEKTPNMLNMVVGPRSCSVATTAEAEDTTEAQTTTTTTKTPVDCWKLGPDYVGNDITKDGLDHVYTSGPKPCQAKCAATKGCVQFVWYFTGRCRLKSAVGTTTRTKLANSGYYTTQSGPPSCSVCYYDSYMYLNWRSHWSVSSDASTPLKCKAYCKTYHWDQWQFVYNSGSTYMETGCYCYNTDTVGSMRQLPKGVRLIGGDARVDNCFYDSYVIGMAVAHTNDTAQDTPLQCKAWCETIPGSTNYQWDLSTGYWGGCYCMHVDKTSRKSPTTGNWGIGGSVTAPAALPVPDCLKTGQDYVGNDITKDGLDKVFTATAVRCQSKCAATEGCVQFVWISASWHCYLKSAVGTASTNTFSNSRATSGPPSCSG